MAFTGEKKRLSKTYAILLFNSHKLDVTECFELWGKITPGGRDTW